MAVDKSIIKEALGNLRKELRGVAGKRKLSAITVTVAPGAEEGEPDGDEEPELDAQQEDEGKPDLLKRAMRDLKGG